MGLSELAVVVLVLARSFAHQCCTRRSLWSRTYIQHNQHTPLYVIRIPLMFRIFVKTTCATTERDRGETTVRDTQHASWRQCCRIETCSRSFVTCSLARSLANVVHGGLLVAHLYSSHSTHSPVRLPTTTRVPKCYKSDSRDKITWLWRANRERCSPCKVPAVLSYRNL